MAQRKINPKFHLNNPGYPNSSDQGQPLPAEAISPAQQTEQLLREELEIETQAGEDKGQPGEVYALVVDGQPPRRRHMIQALEASRPEQTLQSWAVASVEQAWQVLEHTSIDLAVVSQDLPDGDGLELARAIGQSAQPVETVMLADQPTVDLTIEAMRAEVGDLIVGLPEYESLTDRLSQAWDRHDKRVAPYRRTRRLRDLCRQINDARLDVSRQVDSLCDDLVQAYQELAGQMEHAVQSSEYAGQIRDLLDLEDLVRVTLDHLLQKAGPTNAAVFLPMTMDEYSVGGYINLDMNDESSSLVLDHLADVLAPRLNDHEGIVHLTDEDSQCEWLGDDALYLAGQELIAFAANSEDETLAVVVLFRDSEQPFDPAVIEACQAVAPVFGEALCRVVRVHHRHLQ